MARVIGQIESLKTLRLEMDSRNIKRFNSIREIQDFSLNYHRLKQGIINSEKNKLEEEIQTRQSELKEIKKKIEQKKQDEFLKISNQIGKLVERRAKLLELAETLVGGNRLISSIKIWCLFQGIQGLLLYQKYVVWLNSKIGSYRYANRYKKIQFLINNRDSVIQNRCNKDLLAIDTAKEAVDDLGFLIAGAIGESKVESELKKLSNEFVIINDFQLKFETPLYNKKSGDRIFSIQIDHLVISRAGIFLLETKYWSQTSIESLDLRSPIEQINRSSFALFVFINNRVYLEPHHWGDKQVPIRNVLVMVGAMPAQDFKYVKVKTVSELNGYLNYFDPIFNQQEVEYIADTLILATKAGVNGKL